MNRVKLPASLRYEPRSIATSGGHLTVGTWRTRRGVDPATAPVIVAVHGITGNHRCWSYLADSLPEMRVVAPDLRGRGGSSDLGGPYGMVRHADDLLHVIDALEVERVVLVGHSMGGFVSTVFAHRHPDRVSSIVLVDGGLPVTRELTPDPETSEANVTAPLIRRLRTTFRSEAEGLAFWRRHPAFLAAWSPVVADYARYDLGGQAPRLRSRAVVEAVRDDSDDVLSGVDIRAALDDLRHPTRWLIAPDGLLGVPPGLYDSELVQHWLQTYPTIEPVLLSRMNHYTVVLSRAGAEAVAAAVRQPSDLALRG